MKFNTPKSIQKAITEDLIHELQNRGYIRALWQKDDIAERYRENQDFGSHMAEELTQDQIDSVASYIEHNHDCNNGVNWEFIDFAIEQILETEKQ